MPGLTAYFALLHTGAAREGETVVISAASGAVGQVAGQIAKIKGCRAVAVAGSDAKLAWCRAPGYDAGIHHRTSPDLTEVGTATSRERGCPYVSLSVVRET